MRQRHYAVVFTRRPEGAPTTDGFTNLEAPLPEPGGGEVLVAAHYISIDPHVRTMIDPRNPYGTPP
jgi:NADPH-dependent curcumin reductase CurA